MNLEFFTISMLNGLSYGLLLFMLSSGLTLIFSMMGVLNFAHASFYMVGAYVAYSLSQAIGFWWALLVAPMVVFALGAAFERFCLRKVHKFGHVPELLVTFGLSYLLLELVQLIWGRAAVNYVLPEGLKGPLFTVFGTDFPKSRAFIMFVSLAMLAGIWLLLTRTRIGLVIQAALTHPETAVRRWPVWQVWSAATPSSPNLPWPARWVPSSSWWLWWAAWAHSAALFWRLS